MFLLARDFWLLTTALMGLAYWQLRAWGASEGDLRATTVIASTACIGFAIAAVYPEARPPNCNAIGMAFILPGAEQFTSRVHKERWFYMARVIVLFIALMYAGTALITSIPSVFGQRPTIQFQDPTRELSNHGAQLDELQRWRRDFESQNVPGRMMVMERAMVQLVDDQRSLTRLVWGTLVGVSIWLVQQLFLLLMKKNGKVPQDLRVPLGGGLPEPLVHHRSVGPGYNWQPKGSIARDDSRLWFCSNYGDSGREYADVYMLALSEPTVTKPQPQPPAPVLGRKEKFMEGCDRLYEELERTRV